MSRCLRRLLTFPFRANETRIWPVWYAQRIGTKVSSRSEMEEHRICKGTF